MIAELPPFDAGVGQGIATLSAESQRRNPIVRAIRRAVTAVARPQLSVLDRRMRDVAAELERHHMASRAETLAGFRRTRAEARDAQRRIETLEARLHALETGSDSDSETDTFSIGNRH